MLWAAQGLRLWLPKITLFVIWRWLNEAQHCRAHVLSETRKTIQGIKLLFKFTLVPKLPIERKKILRGWGNLVKSTIVGEISIWDETKILLHGRGYLILHFKHAEFEKGESSLFLSDSLCLFKVDGLICCVSGMFLRRWSHMLCLWDVLTVSFSTKRLAYCKIGIS